MSNEQVEVKEREIKETPQRPFVKSVLEFQNKIKFYEKIIFSLVVANILFAFAVMFSVFSDPLVIMEKDAEKLSFHGVRKEVAITEKEIKKLVESFIRRRYEWDKFSIENMMANLSPILSSGLKGKIADDLTKEEKASKYQAFSQYVGKINITIDEGHNIVGTFDKILRIHNKISTSSGDLPIEKIPLLSEAQVMVKVVKGSVTEENPLGLYINAVVNYEPR
ncbi:MAG: hypothetical protein ACOYL6_07960 [Bacteriovoracaceae bacterium]